jgi:hypothetical protein
MDAEKNSCLAFEKSILCVPLRVSVSLRYIQVYE